MLSQTLGLYEKIWRSVRKKVGSHMKKGNPWALLPIAVFLLLFILVGVIDQRAGGMFGDSMPAIVGFLIALIVAFLQNPPGKKLSFDEKLNSMARGAGEENIMIMCLVFILAGAFSASVKAAGGADATEQVIVHLLASILKIL